MKRRVAEFALFFRIPLRPSEEQLAVMRKARMKERKMYFLIHEITVHLIFMVIIALVTYGHKDTRSVHLYRQIDSVSTMTDQVRYKNPLVSKLDKRFGPIGATCRSCWN